MTRLGTTAVLFLVLAGISQAAPVSELWGAHGEKWTPTSRLPDFSQAGCREWSDPKVTSSVKDFGAKGDGVTDDTEALTRAVAEAPVGALLFPEGRYVLQGPLRVERSGLVLRGEGPDKTVLVCPRPLSEIEPLASKTPGKARYAFTGGFVVLQGKDEGKKLADVIKSAKRGDKTLTLSNTAGLKAGDLVRLEMNDSDGSLGRHIHGDLDDAAKVTLEEMRPLVSWVAEVKQVEGNVVTLGQPLRLDVRPDWQPTLSSYRPTLANSGIENMTFEFPGTPKKAHLQEDGFNAIHLVGAFNCRVKNIAVIDGDNAVIVGRFSRFCTVENIRVAAAKREGMTGHHALWATGGAQDCLFRDFHIETSYVHDLSVEGRANGNVFSRGSGVALNFDHHRNAPYENLFSDLKVGDPKRVWKSSGRGDRGPHSGARETFWNISGDGVFPVVPAWPQINVIGMRVSSPGKAKSSWVESAEPVVPTDLQEAQRERRKAL